MSFVQVRTDSNFVVNSLNFFINKWRQNGYTKGNGEEVKHRRIFEEIDHLFQQMTVEVVWNPRNSDFGSSTADRLGKPYKFSNSLNQILAKDAAIHHERICLRRQEEEDFDEDMDCSEDDEMDSNEDEDYY